MSNLKDEKIIIKKHQVERSVARNSRLILLIIIIFFNLINCNNKNKKNSIPFPNKYKDFYINQNYFFTNYNLIFYENDKYNDSIISNTYLFNIFVEKQLNNLLISNPYLDFFKSVKSNDFRFIAVMGYSLYIPGIKYNMYKKFIKKYKYKLIYGTSDCIMSESHNDMNDLSDEYAFIYNKLLINYLLYKK